MKSYHPILRSIPSAFGGLPGEGQVIMKDLIPDSTYRGLFFFETQDSSPITNYTWTVGEDARVWETPNFELSFGGFTGTLGISLQTDRLGGNCVDFFPQPLFSTKTVTIIDPLENPPFYMEKDYIGNNVSEPDSLPFTISFYYNVILGNRPTAQIKNLPRNTKITNSISDLSFSGDWKTFVVPPRGEVCCQLAHGYGQFSDNKREVRIEYKYLDRITREWRDEVFIGRVVE
jgi:hypothetical protein